jgi:ABC-type sugar transport system ATPase subunit
MGATALAGAAPMLAPGKPEAAEPPKGKIPDKPLEMGHMTFCTGPAAVLGEPSYEGHILAAEEINAQGGFLGKRKIETVTADEAAGTDANVKELRRWLVGTSRRGATPVSDAETDRKIFELFPELHPLTLRHGLYLSGGEKTMAAIACAIALEPSILLLDEAFEGLAPVMVKRFCDAATKIKDMGVSLLIAESNLMTATKVADRLYAIDRGEIIFAGRPQEVLQNEEVMRTIQG